MAHSPNTRMGLLRIVLLLVGLAVLCGACAWSATPPAEPTLAQTDVPLATLIASTALPATATGTPTPPARASPVYTMTTSSGYVDVYVVDPGLDDPAPPPGGRVSVRARLIKNRVRVGGMSTEVTWIQGGELQVCTFFPVYLSGCVIEVRGFAPGVYVPVTVTMRYNGMVFTGYSGFTPQ